MRGERPTPPEVATTAEALRTQLAALQHEDVELQKELESAQSKCDQDFGRKFYGLYGETYRKNFGELGFPVGYTRDDLDRKLKQLNLTEKDIDQKYPENFVGQIQRIVNDIDGALRRDDFNEYMEYPLKSFLSQLKESLTSPEFFQKAEAIDVREALKDRISSLQLQVREVLETAKSSDDGPSSLREMVFPKERTDLKELESWINEKLLRFEQIGVPVKGFER